jgi:hypothetical protein
MFHFLMKRMEKINWKHWLFFFLLSQSIYFLMLSQTIPQISRESGGMKPFDMMPLGYSLQYANSFLSHLTDQGYSIYKYVQLPLDTFFPILNFGAGFCMLVLLFRSFGSLRIEKISRLTSFLHWISLFLPFLAMICDYIENILIINMLTSKEIVPIIVSAANIFTILKSMSTTIFYSICLLVVILISIRWMQNKLREKKAVGKLQYTREEKGTIEDNRPR